jgi:hypothetical protein
VGTETQAVSGKDLHRARIDLYQPTGVVSDPHSAATEGDALWAPENQWATDEAVGSRVELCNR